MTGDFHQPYDAILEATIVLLNSCYDLRFNQYSFASRRDADSAGRVPDKTSHRSDRWISVSLRGRITEGQIGALPLGVPANPCEEGAGQQVVDSLSRRSQTTGVSGKNVAHLPVAHLHKDLRH